MSVMDVTFRTLKQQEFQLNLGEHEMVIDVKRKVEIERGSEFKATSMNLVYRGKLMEDEKRMKDYNVTDEGYIIAVVITKPRFVLVDNRAFHLLDRSSTARHQQPTIQTEISGMEIHSEEQTSSPNVDDPINHPQFQRLCALVQNYPESLPQCLGRIGAENPAFLHQLPTLVQAKPETLPQILRQICTENPAVLRLLQENEEHVPDSPNYPSDFELGQREHGEGFYQGITTETPVEIDRPQMNEQELLEREQHISFGTHTERAAITRLKNLKLGFTEQQIINAYLACGKNEEAAANFLLNGCQV